MARSIALLLLSLLAGSTAAADSSHTDSTVAAATVRAPADSSAIPRARLRVAGTPVAVLRSGPGAQHAIVTTVLEGDVLVVDARSGAWLHATSPDGASGWVHEKLLSNDVDRRKFTFVPDPRRMKRQRTLYFATFFGSYAADREDNGFLYGARMGYALTPRFSFEVGAGRTRVVRNTFVLEQLFNLRLEEETFDVFFYEAGLNVDILPGRRVTPFVAGAVGATILNSRVEPTWSLALGTRAFMTRFMALRWEIRDHHLKAGNQFTRFTGDNVEFSAGAELLF